MLVTDRRRSFAMREEQHEQDPGQGSLFAPDSLAPPARPPSPARSTPDPFARARAAAAAPPVAAAALPVAAPTPPVVAPDAAVVAEDDLEDLAELEPVHAHRAPARSLLAGPTLDDIMSRAWEGLRAEVPTPCPVCHTEIEPAAAGRCGNCGSTLH